MYASQKADSSFAARVSETPLSPRKVVVHVPIAASSGPWKNNAMAQSHMIGSPSRDQVSVPMMLPPTPADIAAGRSENPAITAWRATRPGQQSKAQGESQAAKGPGNQQRSQECSQAEEDVPQVRGKGDRRSFLGEKGGRPQHVRYQHIDHVDLSRPGGTEQKHRDQGRGIAVRGGQRQQAEHHQDGTADQDHVTSHEIGQKSGSEDHRNRRETEKRHQPADPALVDPELLRQRQLHAAQQGKTHAGDQQNTRRSPEGEGSQLFEWYQSCPWTPGKVGLSIGIRLSRRPGDRRYTIRSTINSTVRCSDAC